MSNETQYTPGPWKVTEFPLNPDRSYAVENTVHSESEPEPLDYVVAEVCETPGQDIDLADAYLIAAAPELLEAAQQALKRLEHLEAWTDEDGVSQSLLRAAIAKAKGQT